MRSGNQHGKTQDLKYCFQMRNIKVPNRLTSNLTKLFVRMDYQQYAFIKYVPKKFVKKLCFIFCSEDPSI